MDGRRRAGTAGNVTEELEGGHLGVGLEVPGCGRRRKLQTDHRNPFGRTGITKLDDLARLCPWHHYMKTFLGYTYSGGPGTWRWIPPEHRDEDLSQLRKVITSARRC